MKTIKVCTVGVLKGGKKNKTVLSLPCIDNHNQSKEENKK